MIEVEDVWRLIDSAAEPLPAARIGLDHALGRALAEPALADADGPPFDRVTVDGYAVNADDDSRSFRVTKALAAGDFSGVEIGRGEAVRIFTGAPLPSRGLHVIMQEDAVREGDLVRFTRRGRGSNFRERGEDFRKGDCLLASGTRLDASALAVLASMGLVAPLVVKAPRIIHFTTGDEIVRPEETPRPGQIRNGNAILVRSLLSAFPRRTLTHVHLPDDYAEAMRLIQATDHAAAEVLLFSGGASVGDFDFTGRFLEALDFRILCSQVNVRPGKPLMFATCGRKIAFGIPGNPVSHFVCFHLFVARALCRLQGLVPVEQIPAQLLTAIPGRPNPRVTFWPARISRVENQVGVTPQPWNSSGHLASLVGVDALIRLEANTALPNPGDSVSFFPVAG